MIKVAVTTVRLCQVSIPTRASVIWANSIMSSHAPYSLDEQPCLCTIMLQQYIHETHAVMIFWAATHGRIESGCQVCTQRGSQYCTAADD